MSQSSKTVVVLGATGAQGGGLVRAILDDPSGGFSVRAVTRDLNSPKAKALAAAGAQVVAASVDDDESLARAFDGAYAAYCVTFFWDHFSPEKENAQAASMARAARNAALQHVVWSTLEDTRKYVSLDDPRMPTLMGKYKVPHFDSKGEADSHFAQSGVPTTFLLTSFYWDNLIHFGMGPRRAEGKLSFALPMGDRRLPGIAAEDIGRCAYGVLKAGAEFKNKYVGIAGEHLTGAEMAASLSRAFKEDVAYIPVPFDAYRQLGFPGAEDLGNMFQFKHDFQDVFVGARDLALSRRLNPKLHTFDQWLVENVSRIPIL